MHMNKTTKGALAGGAAAALLLGGLGSLAYWTDAETIGGGAINSGHLALVTGGANNGCGAWQLDSGEAVGLTYVAGDPLVPGDVLTRVCNYTIDAAGNHLRATVDIDTPTLTPGTGSFGSDLTTDVSDITVDGVAAASFTEANNGDTLTATVTLTFASTSGNTTQDVTAVLDDLTLTATQVHG
jgi:alternate signal-mediated exported protein